MRFERVSNARGLSQAYQLNGTFQVDSYVVTMTESGRFVLRSRVGTITPISPPSGCQVDSSTQLSCSAGLVKKLSARLKRGRDVIDGGPGKDLIRGGRGRDNVSGGPGDDNVRR